MHLLALALGLALSAGVFMGGAHLFGVSFLVNGGDNLSERRNPKAASRWLHIPSPWYARIGKRPVSMRGILTPFSGLPCGPDAATDCYEVRHNSQGFRGPEYTIAHPPDTLRVVVVGDSFTWGDGVPVAQTYQAQLQQRLDETRRAGDPHVEVIALGINGSSLFEHVIRVLAHAAYLQPDLVLVQLCHNDLEYRPESDWQLLLERGDAVPAWQRVLGGAFPVLRDLRLTQDYVAHGSLQRTLFRDAVTRLLAWSRQRAVPVAFVTFPSVLETRRPLDAPRDAALLAMEDEVRAQGAQVLSLHETMTKGRGGRGLEVSPSNAHYNGFANGLVADALFTHLRSGAWLDLHKTPPPEGAGYREEKRLRDQAAREWHGLHESYAAQAGLFDALLRVHPQNPWLLYSRAYVAREQGDLERSRTLLETLAQTAPEVVDVGVDLFYAGASDPERVLTASLARVPDNASAAAHLADLWTETGDIAGACGCYRRAMLSARFDQQRLDAEARFRALDCAAVPHIHCPGHVR